MTLVVVNGHRAWQHHLVLLCPPCRLARADSLTGGLTTIAEELVDYNQA